MAQPRFGFKLAAHEASVNCLIVSAKGALYSGSGEHAAPASLVTGCTGDHHVHEWQVTAKGLTKVQSFSGGHRGAVAGLALVAGGKLFSCSFDRTVVVWSGATGRRLQELHGHTESISSISSCCAVVCTGSWDGTVRLWELKRLGHSKSLAISDASNQTAPVHCICSHPNRRLLFVAGEGGVVQSFDLTKMNPASTRLQYEGLVGTVNAVVASKQLVAAAGTEGGVWVWESGTAVLKRCITASLQPIFALAMLPDDNIATAGQAPCCRSALVAEHCV